MTTEHVSVPRDELEEIARELSKYEAREVAYYARHFGEELQAILTHATPSERDIHADAVQERAYQLNTTSSDTRLVTLNPAPHASVPMVPTPYVDVKLSCEMTSAPRVVTAELQDALDYLHTFVTSSHNADWQKKRDAWDIVRKAALESFATSLPAAMVPDRKDPTSCKTERDVDIALGWNACIDAMLAGPQPEKKG